MINHLINDIVLKTPLDHIRIQGLRHKDRGRSRVSHETQNRPLLYPF